MMDRPTADRPTADKPMTGKPMQGILTRELPGENYTPYSLARKLGAAALLESSSFSKGKERYSLMLIDEAFRLVQEEQHVYWKVGGKRYRLKGGDSRDGGDGRDILDYARRFADQLYPLPGEMPLPAGGIGFLSYEFAAFCDEIPFYRKADPDQIPEGIFLFGHTYLIFDHYTDRIHLAGVNYRDKKIDLAAALDRLEGRIQDLNFNFMAPEGEPSRVEDEDPGAVEAGRREFLEGVRKIKREIEAGNLLQGVLSRRRRVKTDMSALEAYRRLRSLNPSPYMFYLDLGEFQLFGASPEAHIKVKRGRAEIHPIAGTRRRGETPEEDRQLGEELRNDPKEQAEHLMLVDLARNDLGRVCRSGTVDVTGDREVEMYSHVMHLVSRVEGDLREGLSGPEAVRASFPAGTVSGAPKIQAIRTLDQLEREPRRFYAGLVGYMEPGGDMDTCITIRSALKRGDQMVLQAGAGIVFDSQPERELEETEEKMRALARTLGLED